MKKLLIFGTIATAVALVGCEPDKTAPQKPKVSFKDCDACPEMVVVPAGTFTMGSPRGERGRSKDEGPQHQVTIPRPFAVGKYEVTFTDWYACVAGGGCNGYRPGDEGWGRGRRPVIHVSWKDARAYIAWLSQMAGKTYRLLSEAEWEYATRAGTESARSWGDSPDSACGHANVHDRKSKQINKFKWAHHDCDDGYAKTAPVGSFRANRFGLYDTLGNVWEWVEDCWHDSYRGAPADGSAWTIGVECGRRVHRGGDWLLRSRYARSASRVGLPSDDRASVLGFRVARTY